MELRLSVSNWGWGERSSHGSNDLSQRTRLLKRPTSATWNRRKGWISLVFNIPILWITHSGSVKTHLFFHWWWYSFFLFRKISGDSYERLDRKHKVPYSSLFIIMSTNLHINRSRRNELKITLISIPFLITILLSLSFSLPFRCWMFNWNFEDVARSYTSESNYSWIEIIQGL